MYAFLSDRLKNHNYYLKNGIMYDDIALFVEIVRRSGLSAAADYLGMPLATLSRRLKKLEGKLGVQLIRRSARQFVLSAEGEAYYQAYAGLFAELDNVQKTLSAQTHELAGRLSVLAPTNISIGLLEPMWQAFIKKYPQIHLDLNLSNTVEDMIAQKADLALRIGPQADSSLNQRRLGAVSTHLVASPEYLAQHGCPASIHALEDHSLLGLSAMPSWELTHIQTHQQHVIRPHFSTRVNDVSFLRQLVCGGAGIALLPSSEALEPIKRGQITALLPAWRGPQRVVVIVWPSGKLLSARAQCFRDFIIAYFQNELGER